MYNFASDRSYNIMADINSDLAIFNRLFLQNKTKFVHFAYTYVKDWAIAEDFTTEAFLYYWEKRETLAPESNLSAYILTVIKHKCLNYLEHLEVRHSASENIREHAEWDLRTRISTLRACEPEELFSMEIKEIISKTLEALPERSRRIFVLSRYRNKSYTEIASILNISIKTVEAHVTKTLKILRTSLKDYLS
jgi:RNA polymerase sigma-70 factor (ECF subfamily)